RRLPLSSSPDDGKGLVGGSVSDDVVRGGIAQGWRPGARKSHESRGISFEQQLEVPITLRSGKPSHVEERQNPKLARRIARLPIRLGCLAASLDDVASAKICEGLELFGQLGKPQAFCL